MKPPCALYLSLIYGFVGFASFTGFAFADGLVRPLQTYQGSLAERSQEAIIVFTPGTETESAKQDLIIKIKVVGKANDFAWVVPLPKVPETAKAKDALFLECFNYVEARRQQLRRPKPKALGAFGAAKDAAPQQKVEVVRREVVGSYDVAIVREKVAGTLNEWLKKEGYQPVDGGEDVIEYYRKKDYVFACAKVSDVEMASGQADLHPLRFTFETGGRDGIYFPMKLTGLQEGNFDVNLYVFYKAWLNDHINGYGYEHRGFRLHHRDWDTTRCKANAGKSWSLPKRDVYLKDLALQIPTLTTYFQARHPGKRFYLTNIRGQFDPEVVREWAEDLWMYPYYTDPAFIPYDKR